MGVTNAEIIKVEAKARGNGNLAIVTQENPGGAMDKVLAQFPPLESLHFTKATFDVRCVPSIKPHTGGNAMHDCLFVTRKDVNNRVIHWNDQEWDNVISDKYFVEGLMEHISDLRAIKPGLKSYLVMGFTPLRGPQVPKHFYPRSLQSQYRMHIHVVEQNYFDGVMGKLVWEDKDDLEKAGLFFDKAQEYSLNDYSKYLCHFGKQFNYLQLIGRPGSHQEIIKRTMFGFRSLSEALIASRVLQKKINLDNWERQAALIYQNGVNVDGYSLPIRQLPVPGFSIILPTPEDKANGNVDDDFEVWVQPFTTCGPPPQLTPGGAFYV